MSTETRILQPGSMEAPLGEIHFLFLPGRDLFARRAARLRSLAPGHHLEGFLAFMALLSEAQQAALAAFPDIPLPGPVEQATCRGRGIPLLDAGSLRRDPAWRGALGMILEQTGASSLPAAAAQTIARLQRADSASLERTADRIVQGNIADVAPGELPFIAAALQVSWSYMASFLGGKAFGRVKQATRCPVCGMPPAAGIVRSTGKEQGLRYLSCSLCSSEWHMVRIKCSRCEATAGIEYYALEGSNGAVKAEVCGGCTTYLKLMYLQKEPHLDAVADDLATLALDRLMEKEGKKRGGLNLLCGICHFSAPH